ncbi:MAG: DUF4136 domain-containing protein [Ginsengibacter sp.]
MKKIILFFLACSGFAFCHAQEVVVGADNSFTQSLNNYSTYAWSKSIDRIPSDKIFVNPGGVYVFNNESVRLKIKNAIAFELSAKGYKRVEKKPGFIVLFTVTERKGSLRTYHGYQMIDNGLDSVRTPQDVARTPIDAGTLIINAVDAKSGIVAWQGFASGILKPGMINNQMKVREAVGDIFNKFPFHSSKP